MKKHILIFLIAILIATVSFAQVTKSDTLNKTDVKGKKQGYWKKYSHDTLKYEGRFKDDMPTGEFKYYYNNGKLKAVSKFATGGKFCSTIMYYPSGKKEADGFFTNQKKDSVWKYYTENDTVNAEEHYKNCLKNGDWKFFYSNGVLNEEVYWVNGVRNGLWKMYYSDGSLKSECKIINDKREGLFKFYFPSGKVLMSGLYKAGLKDGVWMHFTEEGLAKKKETYDKGILKKTEILIPDKKDKTEKVEKTDNIDNGQ